MVSLEVNFTLPEYSSISIVGSTFEALSCCYSTIKFKIIKESKLKDSMNIYNFHRVLFQHLFTDYIIITKIHTHYISCK